MRNFNLLNWKKSFLIAVTILPLCTASQIKVACIGNSITQGYVDRNDPRTYPSRLGKLLGKDWVVKNFGESGSTLLRNVNSAWVKTDQWQEVKKNNPDVVIIKLGTNDSKEYCWKYKDDFVTDYNWLISELRALPSKPLIILCLPIPAFKFDYGIRDSIIRNEIVPFVKTVAKINNCKIIDLNKPFMKHPEWYFDGVHPNDDGYREMAKVVFPKVLELRQQVQKKFSTVPDYRNRTLPVEKRVADLLKRMTLEEKVAQLQSTHAGRPKLDDALFNNTKKLDSMYGNGAGMINPAFDETMEQTIERRNKLQTYLKTKTRLGIPIIFIDEAHHGLVQRNVDVFPHGIGLAASWDTALLTRIYDYVARQASSRGTNLVLAPVVDVTRDPRWGRTGETYGEDPFLNGVLGSAVVKGFQGSSNGTIAPDHVAATLKHFTGHGQPESGNNTGPANYSVRALREFHMEPFRMIVNTAKPACIMASYNEVDEIPSHANHWLLTDVLRKEWNYRGIVVSDWFGIDQLRDKHKLAVDLKDASLKAFTAGVAIDMPYGINYVNLTQLVKEGKIPMKAIDEAVGYILRLKFQMGLFEGKEIDVNEALNFNQKTEGRTLALKIAEESMILLKNQPFGSAQGDNLLPLEKNKYKKIAVIGPFGNINLLGDYSGVPSKNISILQGLKDKVGNNSPIVFAQGCKITANGDSVSQNNYQFIDAIKFPTKEENQKLIDEAVETAKQSDFIVLALGENEQFSREAWNGHPGDMTDLNLQGMQEELAKAISATGKPYVVYLMHGRPLSINWIAQNSPAIIDGWFCGEEAGNAFANILFGDVNPSGKLTISVPRSVGQIPTYYNARPTSRFYDYVTEKNAPLYSFGYGLSYTTYWYDSLTLDGGRVSIKVSNTGNIKGDEIVQLYIHQKSGMSVVRPIKELKGFQRITLNAGETKTVWFFITDEMLKHWTAEMKFEVEPGEYEIMIGPNSKDLQKINLTIK